MSDALLEVDGLSVSYGRVQAVRDVSFSAAEGSLVTLVGANGAGKTSVLNAVAGLLRPRSGTIRYAGKDVTRWSAAKLVDAGLVQVPEGREVLASMTVHENLQLGGWHRRSTADASIEQMYGRFPVLAERRELPAGALSGGEQQMLAMGRALMANPKLLLLDEPSMGLAPILVDRIYECCEEINRQGTTILLVEQNANYALEVSDRGYVLETGNVVLSGDSEDLRDNPEVQKAYLGG